MYPIITLLYPACKHDRFDSYKFNLIYIIILVLKFYIYINFFNLIYINNSSKSLVSQKKKNCLNTHKLKNSKLSPLFLYPLYVLKTKSST